MPQEKGSKLLLLEKGESRYRHTRVKGVLNCVQATSKRIPREAWFVKPVEREQLGPERAFDHTHWPRPPSCPQSHIELKQQWEQLRFRRQESPWQRDSSCRQTPLEYTRSFSSLKKLPTRREQKRSRVVFALDALLLVEMPCRSELENIKRRYQFIGPLKYFMGGGVQNTPTPGYEQLEKSHSQRLMNE